MLLLLLLLLLRRSGDVELLVTRGLQTILHQLLQTLFDGRHTCFESNERVCLSSVKHRIDHHRDDKDRC